MHVLSSMAATFKATTECVQECVFPGFKVTQSVDQVSFFRS